MSGPVITLTTDFGISDFYVAAMKAVLLRHCPNANLIDITHQIFRHDLRSAAFTLERAVSSFDRGMIHLSVVDPGVGSERRLLVAEINGQAIVCPDNGLITWAWRQHPDAAAAELIWRPAASSHTFHGRDIMAPVAGMIAGGRPRDDFIGGRVSPVLLDMPVVEIVPGEVLCGEVIHVDHFGNATTNIHAKYLSVATRVSIGEQAPLPLRRTYAEVAVGEPLALIGSSELLEIAVRNGSAAEVLGIRLRDRVRVG